MRVLSQLLSVSAVTVDSEQAHSLRMLVDFG